MMVATFLIYLGVILLAGACVAGIADMLYRREQRRLWLAWQDEQRFNRRCRTWREVTALGPFEEVATD